MYTHWWIDQSAVKWVGVLPSFHENGFCLSNVRRNKCFLARSQTNHQGIFRRSFSKHTLLSNGTKSNIYNEFSAYVGQMRMARNSDNHEYSVLLARNNRDAKKGNEEETSSWAHWILLLMEIWWYFLPLEIIKWNTYIFVCESWNCYACHRRSKVWMISTRNERFCVILLKYIKR